MIKCCTTCKSEFETIYPNKKFCSKKCRTKDELVRARKEKESRNCDECGDEFETSIPNQRFCSRECGYSGYKRELREGLERTCKRCGKAIETPKEGERSSKYCSEYCLTGKDGKFRVYVLEEENYAGMTYKLYDRMTAHRKAGKYVDDVKVVGVYDNPIQAHLHETQLHLEGYDGFYVERSHFDLDNKDIFHIL